jgi:hypothetical protein
MREIMLTIDVQADDCGRFQVRLTSSLKIFGAGTSVSLPTSISSSSFKIRKNVQYLYALAIAQMHARRFPLLTDVGVQALGCLQSRRLILHGVGPQTVNEYLWMGNPVLPVSLSTTTG